MPNNGGVTAVDPLHRGHRMGAGPAPSIAAPLGAASAVFVGDSPGRGRGVFAARAFRAGNIIETCPVIVLAGSETALIDATRLYDYYLGWEGDQAAIALGLGSLYNHSDFPNAAYAKDYAAGVIRVRAVADIPSGHEIFIRYNTGKPGSAGPLWFDVR
jgi:hypothetical protein